MYKTVLKIKYDIQKLMTTKNNCIVVGIESNLPAWNWLPKTLKAESTCQKTHYNIDDIFYDNRHVLLVDEQTRHPNALEEAYMLR